MKTTKLAILAFAVTFSLSFVACNEAKDDDKIIEVEERDRLIERDRDKVDVDVDADDGKLDVDIDNDKKKVDVEIGKDDKKD